MNQVFSKRETAVDKSSKQPQHIPSFNDEGTEP
jgi:hypothetical protein